MQKKLYSLLLVLGLMLVLPLSIAAVGGTILDVDSQYISCDMPLTNSPSGVNGDAIAIATSDGESCGLANSTRNTYDVALQYRSGPDYGIANVEKISIFGFSVVDQTSFIQINQNDLLRRLVTTKFIEVEPNDVLIVSNSGQGKVNVEGFVVRRHQ